ncbi:MAG TPA: DNA-directed RNA polymerase subunit delta, partial [Bacillota bacterium]|nr:DNA-directed RNA polymerase subunit delta [Bacillota bacterium]
MEMTDRINKRYNDADLACHLLKEKRSAMHYRDIVAEVRQLRSKTEAATPTETAQILTQINLDSRFVHLGKGLWSLKDFSASVSRSVITIDDDGIFIDGYDDED